MAGVAVSLINFLIAMTKDPNNYYTTHCHNNNYNTTDQHQSNNNTFKTSSWKSYDATAEDRSMMITTTDDTSSLPFQYEILLPVVVEQQSQQQSNTTCQPYTTIDYAVFGYFLIATLILLLCLCGFMYIQQRILTISQTTPATNNNILSSENLESSLAIRDQHDETAVIPSEPATTTTTIQLQHIHNNNNNNEQQEPADHLLLYPRRRRSSTNNEMNQLIMPATVSRGDATTTGTSTQPAVEMTTSSPSSSTFLHVLQCVYGPTGGIFITFCITLGLFPSWTTELRSIYECHVNDNDDGNRSHSYSLFLRYANDLYIPLTFVLFNVGDLLGRILSTTSRFQMTAVAATTTTSSSAAVSKKLLYLAGWRLIFFPLLFLCPSLKDLDVFGLTINSDVYSFMVQLLFAITNGYIIATSFAQAPKLLSIQLHYDEVKGQQQKERMSEILSCAVNFGLLSGSVLSLLVTHVTAANK